MDRLLYTVPRLLPNYLFGSSVASNAQQPYGDGHKDRTTPDDWVLLGAPELPLCCLEDVPYTGPLLTDDSLLGSGVDTVGDSKETNVQTALALNTTRAEKERKKKPVPLWAKRRQARRAG
jgi:hypothetical protein